MVGIRRGIARLRAIELLTEGLTFARMNEATGEAMTFFEGLRNWRKSLESMVVGCVSEVSEGLVGGLVSQ